MGHNIRFFRYWKTLKMISWIQKFISEGLKQKYGSYKEMEEMREKMSPGRIKREYIYMFLDCNFKPIIRLDIYSTFY